MPDWQTNNELCAFSPYPENKHVQLSEEEFVKMKDSLRASTEEMGRKLGSLAKMEVWRQTNLCEMRHLA